MCKTILKLYELSDWRVPRFKSRVFIREDSALDFAYIDMKCREMDDWSQVCEEHWCRTFDDVEQALSGQVVPNGKFVTIPTRESEFVRTLLHAFQRQIAADTEDEIDRVFSVFAEMVASAFLQILSKEGLELLVAVTVGKTRGI